MSHDIVLICLWLSGVWVGAASYHLIRTMVSSEERVSEERET